MQDIVTIVGNVATDPTQGRTTGGAPVTNFRLASTHRRFDDATQTWIDVTTNWYSVAAFRGLAENVTASLRAGDSVIVTGRIKIRAWENNGKQGTSVDIEADAIGRDLRWGTSNYRRASRASSDDGARGRSAAQSDGSERDRTQDGAEAVVEEEMDVDIAWADPALSRGGDVPSMALAGEDASASR
ncbi:single-stranded DNA-binding protein [Microbacterium sp. NPDC089695]|uniref:single-stranded DNA-binding protein n=1 Tax=Microbacterium sp. NPDC089695 TaxID=3364198 RepID=UPI003803A8DF